MKIVYTLLLAILPSISVASSYGGAEGLNSLKERVFIGESTFFVKKTDEKMPSEAYVTVNECPELEKFIWELKEQFSCPRDGNSPLAGTTYKKTTSKTYMPCDIPPYNDKSPGVIYECIDGCDKPRVPKIFYEGPYECG